MKKKQFSRENLSQDLAAKHSFVMHMNGLPRGLQLREGFRSQGAGISPVGKNAWVGRKRSSQDARRVGVRSRITGGTETPKTPAG